MGRGVVWGRGGRGFERGEPGSDVSEVRVWLDRSCVLVKLEANHRPERRTRYFVY
jgi:hypothetical protein